MRVRCCNCKETVRLKERVFIDELNTIVHQKCYPSSVFLSKKDSGTFREIIERYSFFEELRPHLFRVK